MVEAQLQTGDAAHRETLLAAGRLADDIDAVDILVRAALRNNRGGNSVVLAVDRELLAGPTAAFVRLFDAGAGFRLGPGSRVMDTGGAKGMTRPLSRPGFLRACWTQLGVAGYFCVNE